MATIEEGTIGKIKLKGDRRQIDATSETDCMKAYRYY